ncbi:MAG: 1-acyl-sn-glycerol-3-phosphate acyltransferase, partial [Colwellia sp.]|nr:1-acyl-sn-glycerol-3-phosphate acyltransferase [Colwellia sp.]
KTGAFRTAIQANVPIVPICASNQVGTINLNRWDNGKIIIEFLEPLYIENSDRENLRKTVNQVHELMKNKIEELSDEAAAYHNK